MGNELLRSAVAHKLAIIGEAAHNVSRELQGRYPSVDWQGVVDFRNIVVHSYFAVDWAIVWTTAIQEVPELRQQIAGIMSKEAH